MFPVHVVLLTLNLIRTTLLVLIARIRRTATASYPRMLGVLAIVLMLLFAVSDRCEAQRVARINCEAAHQRDLELAPFGNGPLQLKAVYCQRIRATSLPRSPPTVSPDGQSIAYVEHDAILRIARLDAEDTWFDYRTEMGPRALWSKLSFHPCRFLGFELEICLDGKTRSGTAQRLCEVRAAAAEDR